MMQYDFVLNWDLDGVLADFDDHFETTFGMSISKAKLIYTNEQLWDLISTKQNFYRDIPLIQDTHEIFEVMRKKENVLTRIITGRPRKDTMPLASTDKLHWIQT